MTLNTITNIREVTSTVIREIVFMHDYIQGEKNKLITLDLLVEGGIFALLQHGLNPTF